MFVIKRDGTKEEFCLTKIENALLKAFNECIPEYVETNKQICHSLAEKVLMRLKGETPHVEYIQDTVELVLMQHEYYAVAKKYITYRYLHTQARNQYKEMMEAVSRKLEAKDVQNQNANMDEWSFGGRINEATSLIMKQYALDYCMSKMARENHLNNEVYIHDLDHYAVGDHNCMSIPFDDLLAKGFNTRQIDVRPAGSLNTAMQLVAVIFQLQSLQQFGGVSATHLDWTMVPYVRKSFAKHYEDGLEFICHLHIKSRDDFKDKSIDDPIYNNKEAREYAIKMTEKECHQAVEALYHNLNTLQSRSGCQLPFTSINYGTCTLPEGRMITKELLTVSIEGLGKYHRTSIFPCGIFQCMKGVNRKPEDPNYDLFQLALKSTATRLYPNYANCDWSVNKGYDINDPKQYVAAMGCRTYNGFDINGLGQQKDGRGNICPVTVILPTLAMEAKEQFNKTIHTDEYNPEKDKQEIIEIFFNILDKKIGEAKDMLIERFEYICKQSPESAKFMYENNIMAGYVPEEGIRSALKHGTLALGQLGLAETLEILVGCNHTKPEGMELAKRIEQLFNTRCKEFKERYKLNIGVYYTPAENLCYTAMKKFQNKYGIIPKVSDKEYFTNSIHIPVSEEISIFTKIDLESQLTGYSNAGCITYIELDGGVKHNPQALESIVNYAMDKDIPYFAVNIPVDHCMNCHYDDEIEADNCPQCGSDNIERLRRVTGYLTGNYKTAFNKGKQQEVEQRVKHNKFTEE